ncbi:hypothetical protein BsWGS_01422 [Bradybaena similaris]
MAPSTKLIDLLRSGYYKNSRAVQQELQHGGDPNFVHPTYGVSALHLACGQGDEATQLLLLHGGDPNIVSAEGLTPLHVAASWGDWKALHLLLKRGADISIQDQDGKTAYDLAVENGNEECAQILKCHVMKTIKKNFKTLGYVDQGKTISAFDRFENKPHHRDISVKEFELPLRQHSDTITERVYKYLEEGKQICIDATSPNNPTLEIRSSEIAGTVNDSCAYQKHLPQTCYNRFQEQQDIETQNISSSPELDSGSNRSTSICDHCACSIHNSQAHVNCAHNSHPCHMYQMCTSKHLDEQFCNLCSHCYLNTPSKHVTCTRPQMLHESCRSSTFSECCGQTNCNARSSFCKHDCHLHSVISPRDIKLSTFYGDNMSCSSSVINREHLQTGTRHCCNVAQKDTMATKLYDCQKTVFSIKSPPQNCKPFFVANVTSQCRHSACSPSKERQHKKESQYSRKNMLHAPENSLETSEVFVNSLTEVSDPEYEQQDKVDTLQRRFSYVVNVDDASVTDKQITPLSDYFSTELSELDRSPTKSEHESVACLVHQDHDSGVAFASGKMFPSLLNGSVPSSCFDGSTLSFLEMKDDCRTKIGNKLKKAKRKSLLKPQEIASPLPKSHMKPQERVAEFILSMQNYMSSGDCVDDSFAENISPVLTRPDEKTQFSEGRDGESVHHVDQTENLNKLMTRSCGVFNISESSVETFATCDEGYSDYTKNVNAVSEKESKVNQASSAQEKTEVSETEKPVNLIHAQKHAAERSPSKWKPPISALPDDDIMTSDDSYVCRSGPRIYRMKMKHRIAPPNDVAVAEGKQTYIFSRNDHPVSRSDHPVSRKDHPVSRNDHPVSRKDHPVPRNEISPVSYPEITRKDTLPQIFPVKERLSSDSLFSSVSVKEYVYEDKEENITLIERHIPSDYGSSIGRRSLDSTHSKRTIDSEATLIYDWQSLNEVLRADGLEAKPQSCGAFDNRCATVCDSSYLDKNVASSQANNSGDLSPDENISCTTEDDDGDNVATVVIPVQLEKMTSQEISQELQKYGEIPGPVIPATRQAYLRRLTTLQSNPGLLTLSKACPDYPNEMQQALNGQFDISGLVELESNMIDVFNAPKNGHSWREGTEKSSFTYLLLDPRITDNLPLRSKNLTDVEVFKTFIYSIFYIGKGKRSRPYCHLYEAVSKMNKVNVKMNAKVKQIIDIWNAGLGVVSLHCFQSVIPVEAYTREACMIQAIGLHKLTNIKQGDFYGAALSWTAVQRRKVGVYLLRKALQIFLAEGERQICLPDLKSNQS